MAMVEIDENYIDAKHMKNIIEDEMIRAHQVLLYLIPKTGVLSPKKILDNEASAVCSAKLSIARIS